MKHSYLQPNMDLIIAEAEDVLTTSLPNEEGNISKKDDLNWGL